MKRVTACILALVMVLALAACGGSDGGGSDSGSNAGAGASSTPDNGSTANAGASGAAGDFDGCLNIAIPADPGDLSPFVTMSIGRMYTLETIYEYLGCYEEKNGEFKGQLAKEIDLSDDALTVTVTLYDYITDSAGNQITSADVIWSYEKAIETECSTQTGYIDSIDTPDDYTVIFHLNNALVQGWQGVLSAIPIISQAAYEGASDKMANFPVSTSPYVVDEFVAGSSLHLTKRSDYWQTDDSLMPVHAYPEEIQFDVILESSQMSIALETGAVELSQGMATNEIERFMEGGEEYGNFQVISTPDTRIYSLLFNQDAEQGFFYGKPELRQAIAYAIDAAGLVDGILNGGGAVCMGPGSNFADDFNSSWDIDNYTYNVEKAKELLAAAGYQEGELTLRLLCQSGGYQSATCELVQAYLLAIGINTKIDTVDAGLFDSVKYDPAEWDLLVDSIGGNNYATFAHQFDWSGHSYLNGCLLYDEQWQKLIEDCSYVVTYSDESVKAWADYTVDNCLFYALYTAESYVAAANSIDQVVFTNRSCVYPGDVSFK